MIGSDPRVLLFARNFGEEDRANPSLRRCGDTSAGLRIKPAFLNTEAVADLNPAAAFCRASGIPGPRLAYGISDDDTERGGHP